MPTPHKFWRVKFTNSSGGLTSGIWLDEAVFQDGSGADLCVGGVPFASSNHSSGSYDVTLAFDKTNTSNGWSSAGGQFPCWIGYEFASPVVVRKILFTLPETSAALPGQPTQSTTSVEYSDDGVSYTAFIFTAWVSEAAAAPTYPEGSAIALVLPADDTASGTAFPDMLNAVVARPLEHLPLSGDVLPDMQAAIKPLAFGPGRLSGTLKVLTVPSAREVRLHDRNSGQLLRTTLSDTDGTYAFNNLQLGRKYLVIGLDDTGQAVMRNPGVADMQEAGA